MNNKKEYILGEFCGCDEQGIFEESGLRVILTCNKNSILEEMKEIASTLIDNFEDLRFKDENIFDESITPTLIVFECKHDGEWDEDGLYIEEYVPYKNEKSKFKDLVNKGIIKIV